MHTFFSVTFLGGTGTKRRKTPPICVLMQHAVFYRYFCLLYFRSSFLSGQENGKNVPIPDKEYVTQAGSPADKAAETFFKLKIYNDRRWSWDEKMEGRNQTKRQQLMSTVRLSVFSIIVFSKSSFRYMVFFAFLVLPSRGIEISAKEFYFSLLIIEFE